MFDDLRIKKILVAVDGSENSIKAANYSLFLAHKFDSIVIALYVVPQKGENTTEAIQRTLEKIKRDAELAHIEVKTDVIENESSVINELTEYAKNVGVDLLVIGIRGVSEFRFMLGSTATGVISYAHCPVVVVK